MTTLKQFFCSLFGVLLLSVSLMAADGWTIRLEHGSLLNGTYTPGLYVNGYSTKGVTRVYINNNNQNLNAIQFTVSGNANLSNYVVTWDPNSIVIDNKLDKGYVMSGNVIKAQISGSGKTVCTEIAPSADDQLLAEIQYDIADVTADAVLGFVGTQVISAQRYNPDTDALINVKSTTSFVESGAMDVLEAFNFATVGDAFEMDEDGEPLTIDAADQDHFEASAWNGTAIAPTTDVKFSQASIQSEEDLGTVEVTADGKIVFTPKADFYGEVVIGYSACSTDAGITSEVEDEFTVNVAPVNEAPVVTIGDVSGVEGEALSFTIEYSDDATAWEDVTAKVVTFNGEVLAGSWEEYTFTATDVCSYDLVEHPASSADFALEVAITDNGKGGAAPQTGSDETECTVADTDRLPEIANLSVSVDKAEAKVTETVTASVNGEAVDPDGDEVTYTYAWSKDGAACGTGAELDPSAAGLAKGDEVTVKVTVASNPYGTAEITQEVESSASFTVINSAPVASPTAYSLFIQKEEGVAGGSKDLTLTATDVDGDELTLTNCTMPEAWTVTINGNVATFATESDEELVDQEFTFKFVDDDEAESDTVTVTVNFRQDPPPVFGEFVSEGTPKEAEEEAWVVTTTVADSNTAVAPSGIASVTWSLVDENNGEITSGYTSTVEYSADGETWSTSMPQIAGSDTLYTRCSYLFDYSFIEHPANAKAVKIIVTAADGNGASDSATTDATDVEDTDRAPSAPTAVNWVNTVDPVYGSILEGEATGAEDEDGDEITYVYSWSYSEDNGANFTDIEGASETTLADDTAVVKNNIVKIAAKAQTTPYDGMELVVVSEDASENTITIGNTAPVITQYADMQLPAVGVAEYTEKFCEVEEAENSSVLVGADVDLAAGRDTLTWELDKAGWDDAAGSIEIVEMADGQNWVKYTQAADYFNNGENMPYVIVNLKDDTDTSATNQVKVSYLVGQINDNPVVKAADQYVLPDQLGEAMEAEFEVSMGIGEDSQSINAAEITAVDGDIFDGEPELSFEEGSKTLKLTYTVKSDAELGTSATITLKAQDNGQTFNVETMALEDDFQWSEEVTITVFVGASPWYPIITFECADPDTHTDGHTFHLTAGNDVYELTVKGDTNAIMPADYAAAGIPGFKDGTDIEATIYVWTMEAGTTQEVCAEKEVAVSPYGQPGDASCSEESVEADEDGWVTLPEISVPMSSSYELSILDEDGKEVQTVGGDFTPNSDGIILPVISDLSLQIPESGTYTVVVKGTNPNGDGEEAQVLTIQVPEDTEAVVEWTGDEFLPEEGRVLTTAAVKLSWPVATNAESYTVRVYGPNGKLLEEATKLFETNYTTTKTTATEKAQNYSWYVSAIRDGKVALASEFNNFTLATSTKDVIPAGVSVAGANSIAIAFEGVLADGANVKVDCLYYSCATNKWTDSLNVAADTSTAGKLVVDLPNAVAEGDYVVLYIYVDGKLCGESTAYMVQAGN